MTARDGLRGRAVVAGEHDDADAQPSQGRERLRGRGLDRIRDRDRAGEAPVDRHQHHGGAVVAQPLGLALQCAGRDAELRQEGGVAERHRPALDRSGHALAARRVEVGHRRERDGALGGGVRDRAAERMLARALDAGREPQQLVLGDLSRAHNGDELRLAFGQGAGLVHHQRGDAFHPFERLGILDQNPGLRAAADPDHDRHRGGEAERAGAGDDQHRDGRHQPIGEPRFGAIDRPGREGGERDRDYGGHEPARHLIGETLDRGARTLRARHHLDDLGQHGVAADPLRPHHEAAGAVEGATDHMIAGAFADRHRFAGHHRLVDGGAAFGERAVERDFFARAQPQQVTDRDGVDRNLLVGAALGDAPCRLRGEVEERADRPRGVLARAQLQHLAEQHQRRDDGGGLEIDRDGAVMGAERGGKQTGPEGRDHAVAVGDAGSHGDQREHVEMATDERARAAFEERPAGPQHHRAREGELDEARQRRIDPAMRARDMGPHLEHHHGRRERERNPETARHVGELGIGPAVGRGDDRLERHAADRAGAGTGLADLGMHRAGIDGAGGRRLGRFRRAEIRRGVRYEFGPAAR
jgi:hypothetical protein